MEYGCRVWAGAPSYYLELLDRLQKRICKSFGPLGHRRNVASLSLFYRNFFGRCSSELAQLVSLIPKGALLFIQIFLHHFSVSIPRCIPDVCVNSFFLARLDSGILCL